MAVIGTTTKLKAGGKAAKSAVKNPGAVFTGGKATTKAARPFVTLGAKARKPLTKRRARRRIDRITAAVRGAADELVTYGPSAAQELGLVEAPKPKRTAPRLAAGMVIGAATVYFLEPEHGREHREKVASLIS